MMPEPSMASVPMLPNSNTSMTTMINSNPISSGEDFATTNGLSTTLLSTIKTEGLSNEEPIPIILSSEVPDTILMIASTYASPKPTVSTTYTKSSIQPISIIVSASDTASKSSTFKSSRPPTFIQPFANYLTTDNTHPLLSRNNNSSIKERLDAVLNGQFVEEELSSAKTDTHNVLQNQISTFDVKTSTDRDLLIQIFQNSLENKKQIQELHDKVNKVYDTLYQMELKSPRTATKTNNLPQQHFPKKRKKEYLPYEFNLQKSQNDHLEREHIAMSQVDNNTVFTYNDIVSKNDNNNNDISSYSELSIDIPTKLETDTDISNVIDYDTSPIKQSIKLRKRNTSDCTYFIRKMLSQEFSRDELNQGGFRSTVKNYKNSQIVTVALSPNRLQKIVDCAKQRFPEEYETLSFPRIVNEKCRKTRLYKEKHRNTEVR